MVEAFAYTFLIVDLKWAIHGSTLKNGMMEIISPPQYYYPDFDTIKTLNSFGDSPIRIKWRQKQNLGNYFFLIKDFFKHLVK